MDASQRTEVTAVLVEGALANAANDKELSRHDMKEKAGCVVALLPGCQSV